MTKRDLFCVLIKIFGLYSLILTVFTIIPSNIGNIIFQFDLNMILIVLGSMFIAVGLFTVLLFKTDAIIEVLKLDEGFDEDQIQFGNLNNEAILKLAIIIIGGLLILDYIPFFLFDVVNAFKYKGNYTTIEGTNVDYFGMATGFINIIIGYLLLNNYKWLAEYFTKK